MPDRVDPSIVYANAFHLAIAPGPPQVAYVSGTSPQIRFDDAGPLTPAADFGALTEWTLCERYYLRFSAVTSGSIQTMFAVGQSTYRRFEYRNTAGSIYARININGTGGDFVDLDFGLTAPADGWYTLGARALAGNLEFWWDGALAASKAWTPTTAAYARLTQTAALAASRFEFGSWAGYDRALTDTEMLDWHTYYAGVFS